jgi:type II secretory pathway pseudopilin PulG
MELLVVLIIFGILGGMTFSAFGGLQNTVKMNEYVLTLEQDVRSVQRSAMLLQRNSGERWLYGLGIDFGEMGDSGEYTVFKWCSPFNDYGDILTKSNLPGYNPSSQLVLGSPLSGFTGERNGYMNVVNSIENNCSAENSSSLSTLAGYDKSTKTPKANISRTSIDGDINPRYVIFESVSGRAFFYNSDGALLNYTSDGKLDSNPEPFIITIVPESNVSSRTLTIDNLSGKVSTETL